MRSSLFKLNLMRKRGFLDQLEMLEKSQYWSDAEMMAYREDRLQRIIRHAYETVPFYREMFDERGLQPGDIRRINDLQKLPVIEKETLRRRQSELLSSSCQEKTMAGTTSGSTGVPLTIVNNATAINFDSALYYRFLRWSGYRWGDEMLLLLAVRPSSSPAASLKKRLSRWINNMRFYSAFDLNDELYADIIKRMRKSPPGVLRGYASAVYDLACRFEDRGISIPLKAVSCTAETLYDFQRATIENAFGKNIFDQYGCGETNSIAFECEQHKGLHVASEHVILEILGDDGQPSRQGNVVVTNLDNYAMPIIRYSVGDQATWHHEQCDCGRNLPLLEKIDGRIYDLIQTPNGNKVHGSFFHEETCFFRLDLSKKYGVREYRVVQNEIDKLTIEFVTDKELSPEDKAILEERITGKLGKMEIEIKSVKSIPLTKMGKKLFVLSQLNRDKWQ